ncbi:hypothetical protein MUGA111182_16870 [Mucilaginibacter galii]
MTLTLNLRYLLEDDKIKNLIVRWDQLNAEQFFRYEYQTRR